MIEARALSRRKVMGSSRCASMMVDRVLPGISRKTFELGNLSSLDSSST